MNKTIYTFWLGEENRKKELISYYKKINKIIFPWKIELGPSEEEHNYLMNSSKFYKKAYDLKIFSYCSDIYRCFKVYNNGGMYIDSGFRFNEKKIKSFLENIINYDYFFVFEKPTYFLSGLFWIKDKNSQILKKSENYLNKIYKKNVYKMITMPIILSKYVYQELGFCLEKGNVFTMESYELSNKNIDNIFYLNSTGSWLKTYGELDHLENVNKGWEFNFNSFSQLKNISKKELIRRRRRRTNFFYSKLYKSFMGQKISSLLYKSKNNNKNKRNDNE